MKKPRIFRYIKPPVNYSIVTPTCDLHPWDGQPAEFIAGKHYRTHYKIKDIDELCGMILTTEQGIELTIHGYAPDFILVK